MAAYLGPIDSGPIGSRAPWAFNDAKGVHCPSNGTGCAVPHLSRDSRPVGSQPPFGVGQSLNPYPIRYRPAFACSDILYPLARRYALADDLPPSLWEPLGLPRFPRVPLPKVLGPASPPAALHLRGESTRLPDQATYLLVHACQPLWHVLSPTSAIRASKRRNALICVYRSGKGRHYKAIRRSGLGGRKRSSAEVVREAPAGVD